MPKPVNQIPDHVALTPLNIEDLRAAFAKITEEGGHGEVTLVVSYNTVRYMRVMVSWSQVEGREKDGCGAALKDKND